jgi:hypothetical protein
VLITATRRVFRQRGYVAEFCPICRSIQSWRVRDIHRVHHVYFIPLGGGRYANQELTCTGCRQRRLVEPFTYQKFVDARDASLDRLVAETRPGLFDEITDRLVLEERLHGNGRPLSADERMRLVTEPFYALAPEFQRRFSRYAHRLDPVAILSAVGTLGAMVAFLGVGAAAEKGSQVLSLIAISLGVLALVGLVATVYLVATASRRYMKRRVVPLLAKALAPLEPRETEIATAFNRVRDRGLLIGKRFRPGWVTDALRAAVPTGAHNEFPRR